MFYLICLVENHCHKKNVEFVGNDLNECDVKTGTSEECQRLCQQVVGCFHFTWLSRHYKDGSKANMCCMKKGVSSPKGLAYGAISGPKNCKGMFNIICLLNIG